MIVFKIKEIRENKDISLYVLAKATKITRSYLRDLENNKKCNPTIQTLCKIADALNVSTKDLYEEK